MRSTWNDVWRSSAWGGLLGFTYGGTYQAADSALSFITGFAVISVGPPEWQIVLGGFVLGGVFGGAVGFVAGAPLGFLTRLTTYLVVRVTGSGTSRWLTAAFLLTPVTAYVALSAVWSTLRLNFFQAPYFLAPAALLAWLAQTHIARVAPIPRIGRISVKVMLGLALTAGVLAAAAFRLWMMRWLRQP